MKKGNKLISVLVLAGMMLTAVSALAGEIRIGITMRMVSENGQKYGQMMMDEINLINKSGGVNGNQIKATLMNDECKSDKGVANANKLIFQNKIHLLIGSTCSSVSLPIVDVTAKAEVPQIIPHSTNAKITQKCIFSIFLAFFGHFWPNFHFSAIFSHFVWADDFWQQLQKTSSKHEGD